MPIPDARGPFAATDADKIEFCLTTVENEVTDAVHCVNRAEANQNDDELYESLGHLATAEALIAVARSAILARTMPTIP